MQLLNRDCKIQRIDQPADESDTRHIGGTEMPDSGAAIFGFRRTAQRGWFATTKEDQ